ncbi:hypothetical protein BHE74_00004563 [Ensete ventricosum]|nr:hypothetical protein BHE74_00004563 [Ensete ventricosum]
MNGGSHEQQRRRWWSEPELAVPIIVFAGIVSWAAMVEKIAFIVESLSISFCPNLLFDLYIMHRIDPNYKSKTKERFAWYEGEVSSAELDGGDR